MKPVESHRSRVVVMDHPLVAHKLSILRDKSTGPKEFRELAGELAMLLLYEATRDFGLTATSVTTPIAEAQGWTLAGKKVAVVPILRAGLGMVDGVLRLLPTAAVGHLGLYRDPETCEPVEYYSKVPSDMGEREVLLVDPMLATGGSANAAISSLRSKGARLIRLLVLVAAPEGVEAVLRAHSDVTIFACAVDSRLDKYAYIVPGLGDAGDRLFGTG